MQFRIGIFVFLVVLQSASSAQGAKGTPIKMDPAYPLKIGDIFYPAESLRAREEGRCVVLMTVSADGRISNESIETSSGFPRLDEACLKGVHGQRMLPATEGGKPVEKTVSIPIIWKLNDDCIDSSCPQTDNKNAEVVKESKQQETTNIQSQLKKSAAAAEHRAWIESLSTDPYSHSTWVDEKGVYKLSFGVGEVGISVNTVASPVICKYMVVSMERNKATINCPTKESHVQLREKNSRELIMETSDGETLHFVKQ